MVNSDGSVSVPSKPEFDDEMPSAEDSGSGDWESRFTLERTLGSGGFGDVLLVTEKATGARLALKRPSSGHPEFRRRFTREIQEQRRAANYNVMPILAVGMHYDWYTMPVSEYSLLDEAPRGMSNDERIAMMSQVASALAHVHSFKILHRDIKPSNIHLISDDKGRRWVLADFGLVRRPPGQTTGPRTSAGRQIGTEGFIAVGGRGKARDFGPPGYAADFVRRACLAD